MTAPGDILLQEDRVGRGFAVAVALHALLIGGYFFALSHHIAFGAPDAGGAAVAIQAVNSIPLPPHTGPQNPLASDTESVVPQAPTKPVERVKKEEPPPPNAVPLKTKKPKKTPSDVASERNRFRPFKSIDPYQVYSKSAPAVSNPIYSMPSTGGRIGTGTHTTLGSQCAAYASQIEQLIGSHWNTGGVGTLQNPPTVDATFDIAVDGTIGNLHLLQRSGIPTLDSSVQRAILDSSPLPRIPEICNREHASAEFLFELKQ